MKSEGTFFYGWIILVACLVTLIIAGTTYYSFGVFFKPLQDEFGWDRTLTSSANMVFLLIYGISLYIMGKLADKYGPRLVLIAGAIFLSSGFVLCSQIHSIWHFYLSLALAGLGQGTMWSPTLATVQRWFFKRRGLALGIVTSGIGIGVLIFIPILSRLISAHGWRLTYIYLGAGSWFFLTLASIAMTSIPQKKGLYPYGWQKVGELAVNDSPESEQLQQVTPQWMTGEAVKTKAFIMMVILYSFSLISMNIIATHFVRFAIDIGIKETTAASAFGLIGGLSIAGRIIIGAITERIGWNWSLAICCFGAAIVVLSLLAAGNLWMIYLFAVFYGFFYGGMIPLIPGLVGYLFGIKSLAQIIGIVTGISIIIGSVGAVIAGSVFDKTGSYTISFILAVASFGLAGILAMVIKSPSKASYRGLNQ